MTVLRPELGPLPLNMRHLKLDERGYPVPWFVAWIDGKPEFRAMHAEKINIAVRQRRCWVCGGKLMGELPTFVIGPMCGINRTSAEPPGHYECAKYSAQNCPFLTKPQMVRRENDMPENVGDPAGHAILRNPGVTLLWTSRTYYPFQAPAVKGTSNPGMLFHIGEPVSVEFFCEGMPASRAQVVASINSGICTLEDIAKKHGEMDALAEARRVFERYLPPHPSEPVAESVR